MRGLARRIGRSSLVSLLVVALGLIPGAHSPGMLDLQILLPRALSAQSPSPQGNGSPLDRCASFGVGSEANQRCNLVVQSLEIIQPPLGMAMSGGNPVPGTASTLGMRLGSVPRLSLGGRATIIGVDIPQILTLGQSGKVDATFPGLSIDGAIGILPGSSPLPTVGGVGSLDLLASIGILPLPGGSGFSNGTPFSWALGLRGGILRESFTLPGISVSAVYRHLGRSTYGDSRLIDSDAFINLSVASLSFRAAASKRLLGVGVTLGAGYDRYSSNGNLGFRSSGVSGSPIHQIGFSRLRNNKTSLYGNLSYTLLVLHLVGEIGWQQGTGRLSVPLPSQATINTGGRIFGGVAARISI